MSRKILSRRIDDTGTVDEMTKRSDFCGNSRCHCFTLGWNLCIYQMDLYVQYQVNSRCARAQSMDGLVIGEISSAHHNMKEGRARV